MRARPDRRVRYGFPVNSTALIHASFVLVPLTAVVATRSAEGLQQARR